MKIKTLVAMHVLVMGSALLCLCTLASETTERRIDNPEYVLNAVISSLKKQDADKTVFDAATRMIK